MAHSNDDDFEGQRWNIVLCKCYEKELGSRRINGQKTRCQPCISNQNVVIAPEVGPSDAQSKEQTIMLSIG
eukprot:1140464-Pelagomonas_calceolata.AAC.2